MLPAKQAPIVPAKSARPQDVFAARQLAQGLTLVPCWIVKDGVRIRSCRWVRPEKGECPPIHA